MSQQFVEPSAATGISHTPSGTSWANSTWQQVIASTGADWYLTSIVVDPASSGTNYEIDIGVGASSSEVVVSTLRGFKFSGTGDAGIPKAHVLPILYGPIASGSRIAVRMRKSQTGTAAWIFALTYVTAVNADIESTTQEYRCLPSAANSITVTIPATVWTYTSFAEITASMPTDSILTHLIFGGNATGGGGVNVGDVEIDIAFGAASSEVVQFTLRGGCAGTNGNPWSNMLPNPFEIPSGTRVSWRMRCSDNGNSGSLIGLALGYLEEPL